MPKKIMIPEDNEATAGLIRFYLKEEGYQTDVSSRGENFVAKVAEYQPDLITVDILLPDTDGFKVFRLLQEDERTRNIPVIFVTVKKSEKEKGLKMGASGYIVKPFSENEFKETIRSVLEKDE